MNVVTVEYGGVFPLVGVRILISVYGTGEPVCLHELIFGAPAGLVITYALPSHWEIGRACWKTVPRCWACVRKACFLGEDDGLLFSRQFMDGQKGVRDGGCDNGACIEGAVGGGDG